MNRRFPLFKLALPALMIAVLAPNPAMALVWLMIRPVMSGLVSPDTSGEVFSTTSVRRPVDASYDRSTSAVAGLS